MKCIPRILGWRVQPVMPFETFLHTMTEWQNCRSDSERRKQVYPARKVESDWRCIGGVSAKADAQFNWGVRLLTVIWLQICQLRPLLRRHTKSSSHPYRFQHLRFRERISLQGRGTYNTHRAQESL